MSIGMFEGDLVVANDLLMPQSSVGIAGFSHQGFRTNFEMPDGMSIAAEETGDGHSRKRGHLLFREPGPDNNKITKEQANFMHHSGVA